MTSSTDLKHGRDVHDAEVVLPSSGAPRSSGDRDRHRAEVVSGDPRRLTPAEGVAPGGRGGHSTAPRSARPGGGGGGRGGGPGDGWADVDTMLIPEAAIARSPGVMGGVRGMFSGLWASLGLSSSGARGTRLGTIVATLAGVVVVVGLLFADQIVMSTVQKKIDADAATTTAAAATASVPYTRIVSSPPAADVVAQGQLVGQTPLSVARGEVDAIVVLRKPGHEPKIIRVGPTSPPTLQVVLTPSATVPEVAPTQP